MRDLIIYVCLRFRTYGIFESIITSPFEIYLIQYTLGLFRTLFAREAHRNNNYVKKAICIFT